MQARPAWRVLNRGVNGERSDEIAARFDRDVLARRPAAVVIIAGVNDVYQGRPAADVIAQLGGMYDRAAAAGIPVVAGSIIPYDTATPDQNARMREINAWIAERAGRDPRVTFVDTRRRRRARRPGPTRLVARRASPLARGLPGNCRICARRSASSKRDRPLAASRQSQADNRH